MGEEEDKQSLTTARVRQEAATATRAAFPAVSSGSETRAHTQRRSDFRDRVRRARTSIAEMIAEEVRFGHGFLWIPVCMGAGATFALGRADDIALAATLVPFLIAAALAAFARRMSPRWIFPMVWVAAFLAGMTASTLEIDRARTTLLDGEVVTHVTGVVTDRQIDEQGHWRYTIDLLSTNDPIIRRPPDTIRLLARSRHDPVPLGEGITGLARISPPSGPALPGGYDFAFSAFFQRIGAIGFFYGPPSGTVVASTAPDTFMVSLRRSIAGVRETISGRIRRVLDGQSGALAAALTVADVGGLSDETMTALRNSGLAHIISISGLHMVLVAGTLFVTLRVLLSFFPPFVHAFPVKKVAAAGALVISTAYLVISGASVPTQRSWIMLAIMLVAVMIDRPAFTLRNVALAAIGIIAVTPSSVVGPSFQMSFAATVALVSGFTALARWRANRNRDQSALLEVPWWKSACLFVIGIAFTSVIAGGATGLFAAYHFHRLTSLGVIGNLLATPAISFVVMPMALLSVLLMPYGLEAWPLKAMGFGLDVVIAVAHHVAALGGIVMTGRLPLAAAMTMGAGFVVLVLMRSRLRLSGVALIVGGFILTMPPFAADDPDILISEDGVLVAVNTDRGLATNRKRPPSFVFDQWLSAMEKTDHVGPAMEESPEAVVAEAARSDAGQTNSGDRVNASPELIGKMQRTLETAQDGRFTCFGKLWCGIRFKGISVITVREAAYLGPACDLATVVVTPMAVRMHRCRSGALLFTGRSLRRTGSTEIYIRDGAGHLYGERAAEARPQADPLDDGGTDSIAPRLKIVSAVDGVIRPWTIQRYYDWHTRSFDFDGEPEPTNDSGG